MKKQRMNDHDWETRFDERFTIDNGPSVERSIKDPNGMAGPIKGFIREELAKAKSDDRVGIGDVYLYEEGVKSGMRRASMELEKYCRERMIKGDHVTQVDAYNCVKCAHVQTVNILMMDVISICKKIYNNEV